ncbi:sulfurtransferase [Luteipulveratus mongoliensis]|uniref:sulfurtransferase n=1 Tax=Luteipulveratus mongoliensis TaxID=571913 RepID=UPI000B2CB13E|nr:sulfurtransferase [Luteipulveratus mongoliensis]
MSWRWCEEHLGDAVLVDARWYWDRPGREAYEDGHVPGAVFVDLDGDLSSDPSDKAGRQPFPEPGAFAEAMGRAGIDGSRPVVAYDDAGGVIASRLVWMLRLLDLDAAVLSGGLAAYPGSLESGSVQPERADFRVRPWPAQQLLTTEDVARTGPQLIDARPANRYRGDDPEVDASLGRVPEADPRRGHIPGAINVPCRGHLDDDGAVKPPEHIRATFLAAGIDDASDVVSYCGAGVTACHNLLAMEYAGLGRGRLYPGSWSAWSRDLALPVETGE